MGMTTFCTPTVEGAGVVAVAAVVTGAVAAEEVLVTAPVGDVVVVGVGALDRVPSAVTT